MAPAQPEAPANPFAAPPPFTQDPFAGLFGQPAAGPPPPAAPLGMHQGSRVALPDEKLIRESMDSLPDDKIVNVELWETDGKATLSSEPIMSQDGILMSAVKTPVRWIDYGGHWYMQVTDPASKKVYRKSFETRGDPAPASYRPRIGGQEMDKAALVQTLREFGVIPQAQAAMPAGAVPQTVYGDVRGEIGKLEAKIERLEKERDDAKDAKNDALRKVDIASSDLKNEQRATADLREQVRDLKAEVKNPSQTGKPDWVYALEVMKKGEGEGVSTKDMMAFQERIFGLVEKMKHGTEGEKQDAFAQLNSSLDFIKKVQGAAGIGKSDSDESTLGQVGKIAGALDKGLEYLASRDKKKSEAEAAKKKTGGTTTASGGQASGKESATDADGAIGFAMNRVLTAFRAGASVPPADWAKSAEPVAGKLVASAIWVTEMELGDAAPEVAFFLDQIKKDPEGILVAFGGKQSPPVPEGFCLEVARWYRLMNGMPEKAPPAKTSAAEPPASGAGQKGMDTPPAATEAPVSPPGASPAPPPGNGPEKPQEPTQAAPAAPQAPPGDPLVPKPVPN